MSSERSAGERLSNWMGDEIKLIESELGKGAAKSFDEYRFMCGNIVGLKRAKNELDNMMRNWEIASDLDD